MCWPARSTRSLCCGSPTRRSSTTRASHKSYPVVDGVPVLLVEEGTDVSDAEHDRLTAKAEKEGVRATGPAPG